MTRWLAFLVVFTACGNTEPLAPKEPHQQALDSAPAVAAIRQARFGDAAREATSVLVADPQNATAAAIRALATYQQAATNLIAELTAVLTSGIGFGMLDHERGRRAWM